MIKTGKYIAAFALLFAAVLTACRKDRLPSDPPPDPCAGKQPVSAAFTDKDEKKWNFQYDHYYYSATAYGSMGPGFSSYIRFYAEEENAAYTWIVQGDPSWFNPLYYSGDTSHESMVHIPIYSFYPPTDDSIVVTLIVQKTPNTACFPNDDGIDTVTKVIRFSFICDYLWEGTFRGVWLSDPNDTFNITIEQYSAQQGYCGNVRMSNFNKDGCDEIYIGSDALRGTGRVEFENGNTACDLWKGVVTIEGQPDSLYADYWVWQQGVAVNRKFKGKKL